MIHFRKCISTNESIPSNNTYMGSDTNDKEAQVFHENPYCKALNNAKDIQCKTHCYYRETVALIIDLQ